MQILEPKISKLHNDSFWYFGQVIATKVIDSRYFALKTGGNIRIRTAEGIYVDEQALDEVPFNRFNDSDLLNIEFDENNWFVIVEVDSQLEEIGEDFAIDDGYDEGVFTLDILKLEDIE